MGTEKDMSRTNYGLYVRQDNFRGRDEIIQSQFVYGYSHRLGISYTIPYLNRKQNIGLSAGFYYLKTMKLLMM